MRQNLMGFALAGGAVCAAGAGWGIVHTDGLQTLWMRAMGGAKSPEIAAPAPQAARLTLPAIPVPTPATAKAALAAPVFDIVQVEPSGETVVAGRAFAKAKVELRDGARPLAAIAADQSGLFVILPEPLAAGEHALRLAARNAEGEESLSDIVRVTVAPAKAIVANKPAPSPTVAAIVPAQAPSSTVAAIVPARTPSSPTIVATAPAQAPPPAVPAPTAVPTLAAAPPAPAAALTAHLVVTGVHVSDSGRLEAEGEADAGTQIRLALNGSYLAEVVAGAARSWSLAIERGLIPGFYVLRAEALDASGHARDAAEASFAFASPRPKAAPTLVAVAPEAAKPAELAPPSEPVHTASSVAAAESSRPKLGEPALGAAPEPTPIVVEALKISPTNEEPPEAPSRAVVAEVRTTTVVRGDNLWDLARKFYGDGLRYADIYSANSNQIRSPKLIFIGQVFVVPQNQPGVR